MKLLAGFIWGLLFFASSSFAVGPVMPPTPTIPVAKKLKIVTTLAVVAELAREIGGDAVEVNALITAAEDPHFVIAKPTFRRMVSEADMFMQIGRSLELWVPVVITSSGNAKLTGDRLLSVSDNIKTLDVPSQLTRALGDIHPEGNPHVWLSPLGGVKMAENIKRALSTVDPVRKANYEKNFEAFKRNVAVRLFGDELVKAAGVDFLFRLHEGKRLNAYLSQLKPPKQVGGWLKVAEAIDYPFMTYHTVWSYLIDELGLQFFAPIEEKSGVAPTLKYQIELIAKAKEKNVKRIIAASYYVGSTKLIDGIAKNIRGEKKFIDADCKPGESFIAMMDRIINEMARFKPTPTPSTPAPAPGPAPTMPKPSTPKATPPTPAPKN